jgi:hypothetical protein
LPGGILRWDPKAGFARKVTLLHGAAGIRVDFRGADAPRPAASRLFIEVSDAQEAAVRVIRAIIGHTAALALAGASKSWDAWFRSFITLSAGLPFWRHAIFDELHTIEQLPVYTVGDDYLSGADLRAKMGRWIVIKSSNWHDVKLRTWGLDGVLLSLREKRTSGDTTEVDLESACEPAPYAFNTDSSMDALYEALD